MSPSPPPLPPGPACLSCENTKNTKVAASGELLVRRGCALASRPCLQKAPRGAHALGGLCATRSPVSRPQSLRLRTQEVDEDCELLGSLAPPGEGAARGGGHKGPQEWQLPVSPETGQRSPREGSAGSSWGCFLVEKTRAAAGPGLEVTCLYILFPNICGRTCRDRGTPGGGLLYGDPASKQGSHRPWSFPHAHASSVSSPRRSCVLLTATWQVARLPPALLPRAAPAFLPEETVGRVHSHVGHLRCLAGPHRAGPEQRS